MGGVIYFYQEVHNFGCLPSFLSFFSLSFFISLFLFFYDHYLVRYINLKFILTSLWREEHDVKSMCVNNTSEKISYEDEQRTLCSFLAIGLLLPCENDELV